MNSSEYVYNFYLVTPNKTGWSSPILAVFIEDLDSELERDFKSSYCYRRIKAPQTGQLYCLLPTNYGTGGMTYLPHEHLQFCHRFNTVSCLVIERKRKKIITELAGIVG